MSDRVQQIDTSCLGKKNILLSLREYATGDEPPASSFSGKNNLSGNDKKGGLKMGYYFVCLKKYATFSGRARRKEFWMFALVNCLIAVACMVLDSALGTEKWIGNIYSIAVLLPSLAVSCRRLHDIGKSGWWMLIGLIPIVGILLLVYVCKNSVQGENQYGPNPKQS